MNVPYQIQSRIHAEVDRYVCMANKHFNRVYTVPTIRYDVRGTTAGYASGATLVRFNPILLMENLETFIARTVPHEVAHCIDAANGDNHRKSWDVFSLRRGKRSIHGPSWQHIMKVFGVDDSTRCHSYDVSNARVKTKSKFEYKCACCNKSYFVSSVLHNKMRMGQERWCRVGGRTRGQLRYIGGLGKVDYTEARKIAASRARSEIVPVSSFKPQSSAEIAKAIWTQNGMCSRATFISIAKSRGLKEATASTYYANLKAGRM